MSQLKPVGFSFVVDDLATGHSSPAIYTACRRIDQRLVNPLYAVFSMTWGVIMDTNLAIAVQFG